MDNLLFAIAIGQALLLASILALSNERSERSVLYLIAILCTFAGLFVVVLAQNFGAGKHLSRLALPLGMLLGLLLWRHSAIASGQGDGPIARDLAWLLPTLVGWLYAAGVPIPAGPLQAAMLLLLLAALCRSLVLVSRQIRRYDDTFSVSGPRRLSWLRGTHLGLAAIVALALGQHLAERASYPTLGSMLTYLVAGSFIVLITFLAHSLLATRPLSSWPMAPAVPDLAAPDPAATDPGITERRNQLDAAALEQVQARLEAAMLEDRCYRQPELMLRDLSRATSLPETSVTEAIRRGLARNFFDYINGHRIHEAQDRLRSSDLTVTEIMYAVGFKSKSSFYTEFRKRLGRTPGELRDSTRESRP